MGMFLGEIRDAEKVVAGVKEVERKYKLEARETAYTRVKAMYKGCSFDKVPQKKRRRTYCILNRPVTPLIFANEKLIESLLNGEESTAKDPSDPARILEQIDRLTLEDLMPDLQAQRKSSKSVNVKRTYLEMHRLRGVPDSLFSADALKSIFTFIDYESMKFAAPHCIVVGHLAAIVFEVSSEELRKLNELVAAEMGYEDTNIRVIRPFKELYSEMVATALKYGLGNLHTVNPGDFVEAVAHGMGALWKSCLKGPAEAFYEICKAEAVAAKGKDPSFFFENLRYRLQEIWDAEIIQRSNDFKRAKIDPN